MRGREMDTERGGVEMKKRRRVRMREKRERMSEREREKERERERLRERGKLEGAECWIKVEMNCP